MHTTHGNLMPKYVQIQAEPELEALLCIGGCPVAASDAVPGWPTTSDVACPPMLVRLKSRGRLCQPLFFLLPRESVIIPPAVLVLLGSLLTSEEEEEEEESLLGGGGGKHM